MLWESEGGVVGMRVRGREKIFLIGEGGGSIGTVEDKRCRRDTMEVRRVEVEW